MPPDLQTDARPLPPGTALALGAFDGFHLGHQVLLARAREGWPRAGVLTFDPHPVEVLAPDRAPARLSSAGQRLRLLERFGIGHLVLLPFTRDLANLAPDAFVDRILAGGLRPAAVVVGRSFRFGRDRAGTPERLAARAAAAGIEVVVVDEVPAPAACAGRPLSSTEIRRCLAAGDVATAACLLGRPHAVEGTVVRGAGRGRTLGIPTANVADLANACPAPGIYAGALSVLSGGSGPRGPMPAAISLGRNPTFTAGAPAPLTLEAHVLDADLDLYGARVEVAFVERLRDEARFEDVPSLLRQIEADIARTRAAVTPKVLATILPP